MEEHERSDVSRETLEKLQSLKDLVCKWNPTINLVSKSSLDQLWDRHIWDSAQILEFGGDGLNWVDIGSGGGFPGLVIAVISADRFPSRAVTMIESDVRKSAFLRTAILELELNATVISQRIEAAPPQRADVLSARALAELPQLMSYAAQHLSPEGTALFMKGTSWEKEVQTARDSWSFTLKAHKSKTNRAAAILEIKDIERV